MISGSVRIKENNRRMEEYANKLNNADLKEVVKEYLSFIDATDESESGNVFHPISFGCCRVLWIEPFGMVMKRMRELVE